MAAVGHFGCPKFTFDRISGHFRSICNFLFLDFFCTKMAAVGHFGCLKFIFDRHFWPFKINTDFLLNYFTKWPPAPILDVRNSLSIAFLAILDQYGIFLFF